MHLCQLELNQLVRIEILIRPGPDPIKKIQRKIWLYAGNWPIREPTIGHVTGEIGQILHWILFIGSGPGETK